MAYESYFRVLDPNTGEYVGNLPTPHLIDAGGGQAWEDEPGHWRSRDDAYDAAHKPADMPYKYVRVVHLQDHRVEVTMTVDDDGTPYTYDDWYVVAAATVPEAERLAIQAAKDESERRWDDANPVIRIDRVRPGVGLFG